MNIGSDHPDHGFQFPGVFEITAMGPALIDRARVPSIRLSIHAEDRSRYEAAHDALRAEPDIKWTL